MFGKRIDLFRLFGFPVRLDVSWFVVAALIAWSLAVGLFPVRYPGLPSGTYWPWELSGPSPSSRRCGDFAARHAVATDAQIDHHYYRYFAPDRPFLLPLGAERLLGKPLVFSINNAWAKYYQVDHKNRAAEGRPSV